MFLKGGTQEGTLASSRRPRSQTMDAAGEAAAPDPKATRKGAAAGSGDDQKDWEKDSQAAAPKKKGGKKKKSEGDGGAGRAGSSSSAVPDDMVVRLQKGVLNTMQGQRGLEGAVYDFRLVPVDSVTVKAAEASGKEYNEAVETHLYSPK